MTLWSTEALPEISADRGFKSLRAHCKIFYIYIIARQRNDKEPFRLLNAAEIAYLPTIRG